MTFKVHSLCQVYSWHSDANAVTDNATSGKQTPLSLRFQVCEMAMVVKRTMETKNSETPSLETITYQCPLNLSALPILHPVLHLAVTYLVCGICWGLLRVLLSSYKTKANMWSLAWHLGLPSIKIPLSVDFGVTPMATLYLSFIPDIMPCPREHLIWP